MSTIGVLIGVEASAVHVRSRIVEYGADPMPEWSVWSSLQPQPGSDALYLALLVAAQTGTAVPDNDTGLPVQEAVLALTEIGTDGVMVRRVEYQVRTDQSRGEPSKTTGPVGAAGATDGANASISFDTELTQEQLVAKLSQIGVMRALGDRLGAYPVVTVTEVESS